MHKIEFNAEVKFGETVIDEIQIHPLTFMEMSAVWTKAAQATSRQEATLQRERILYQTHFMAAGKRIKPDLAQLNSLKRTVAKEIIAALDVGQGKPGNVIQDGDGATTSIIYKLGAPAVMKNNKGEDSSIYELEFMAETYGEIEDVLAADNDIAKTIELLRRIGKPVASKLQVLPGWALDKITTADGVTIMQKVLPHF